MAAVLFYLALPLISAQAKRLLRAELAEGGRHVLRPNPAAVPYYLTPEAIEDYVDYIADAVQVIPAILLPIIGAIYALGSGVPAAVSITFLVAVCIIAIAMNAWVMSRTSSDYVSRKWHGYSLVTIAGMVVNLIGLLMVISLG